MTVAKRKPRRALSIEQRLALGKLAEILSDPPVILKDLAWVSEKLSLGVKPRVDLSAVLAALSGARSLEPKSLVYSVLRAANSKGVLQYCLSELVSIYVSRRSEGGGTPRDSVLIEAAKAHGEPWQTGKRAAAILGYEWVMGTGLFGEMTVVLLPLAGGSRHQEETSRLRSTLEGDHPAALTALRSAYDAYQRGGIDGNRQACEASRNALENVVRDLTGMDLGPGLDKLASDDDRRSRLFKSFRDALSIWGTHAKEQPAERDTYLALRITEEFLVWLLKTAGKW